MVRIHWVPKTVSDVKVAHHNRDIGNINIVVNEERDNQNVSDTVHTGVEVYKMGSEMCRLMKWL